ncbi:hypothetical protein [Henriciella pelagia]|uniref:hypothetical protein n=1 Tax=Henriciella pelagia TaxID=1977912 RepID=UPI00351364F8
MDAAEKSQSPLELIGETLYELRDRCWDKPFGEGAVTVWLGRDAWREVKMDPLVIQMASYQNAAANSGMRFMGARLKPDNPSEAPPWRGSVMLNGAPVWEIDFESGSRKEIFSDPKTSGKMVQALAHAFDGGRASTLRVRTPVIKIVERLPLDRSPAPNDSLDTSETIPFFTVSFDDFEAAGLVRMDDHAHGWDIRLTHLGRNAIQSWIAHA